MQFGRQNTAGLTYAQKNAAHRNSKSRDDHGDAMSGLREVDDDLEDEAQNKVP